jgi:predicted NAD-dependent protein-ADP-ribosyltransferase YbiA (DUF1768 family)
MVSYAVVMDGKSVVSVDNGNVIGFCRSEERWGKFGNMSGVGLNKLFVLVEGDEKISVECSESLFVCMKFDNSLIENELRKLSGMSCKLSAKRFSNLIREDWDSVRIEVMRWVLRVKLFYNLDTFGKLLIESGDKEICEVSNYMFDRKNNNGKLWGVCPSREDNTIRKGNNWLGKLLVELREEFRGNGWNCDYVKGFDGYFCGKKIKDLVRGE